MLRGCFAHEDALLSLVSALAALRRSPVAVKVPQTRSGLEERQLHAHTPTNPAVHMAAVLRAAHNAHDTQPSIHRDWSLCKRWWSYRQSLNQLLPRRSRLLQPPPRASSCADIGRIASVSSVLTMRHVWSPLSRRPSLCYSELCVGGLAFSIALGDWRRC